MANNGSLDPIYNRLNGADRYHPFTADTFSDWSMEAGDTITVTRDGHTYESPVHTSTLRWNGQPQLSVSSEGNESRDSVTRQTKSKYGRCGSGLRNDLAMRRYMSDIYGALTSSLILSESMLRLEFRGAYDGLQSDLQMTRSALDIEFRGLYDGLSSHFELTRSQMQVTFEGLYDGLSSEFLFTRSELRTEFRGLYDGLNSEFQVTRSELRAEFEGLYDGLSSEFSVTRSQLRTEFRGLYDGLNSEFLITRSELRAEFEGLYDGLSSEFLFTRSELRAEFSGLYDGLSSEFKVTRSELRTEFSGMYDGLHGELVTTRSALRTEFSGLYDGLHGELVVTRSELRTEFSGLYDGLHGELVTTRSELRTEFSGLYDGLSSTFQITRSLMAVDFKGAYDGLSSHFETTRSQLVSEFSNTYNGLKSQIQQNASRIGLVVDGNGVKRASIVAAINGNTSSVDIDADNISIGTSGSAQVHISDVFSVVSGAVTISGDTYQTGAIHPNGISMAAGSDITFTYGSAPPKSYVLNQSVITNMIVNADIDGNTLRLWKIGDEANAPSVTFSKATSLPDGTWSGGKYTIHAQQNNSGVATNVATHSIGFAGNPDEQLTLSPGDAVPQVVGTSKYISVPIELRAWRTENNEETYSVVYNPTLTVNATNAWNAGEASGIDSVTIDKIIGVKFGQNEYTRTAIGITAFASNTKSLGAALILSNPTEYTGSDGQTHYCVNLTGKVEQNGQLVDGIIGRVNIDDAYHGGSESVTIDKIIGVKFGQNEYTRTAIGITAIASNDAALGTSLTLSEPTTYTGADNKTHRCIELTGNYVENNQVTSGIIGRVNIDSTYNAGWDHAATSEITTYASHADGATLPFGASVNVSAAIRKSDGTSLSIIGRSYTVQALTTSATSGWDKTTFSANAKVNGNNILNASTSVILQIESSTFSNEAFAKLYKDSPTNTNLLTSSKLRLSENTSEKRVYLYHDVDGDGSSLLQKAYVSTQNTYNDGEATGYKNGYDTAAGAVRWNGAISVNTSQTVNPGESIVVKVPYVYRNNNNEVTERSTKDYTVSCPALTTSYTFGWSGTTLSASATVNGSSIFSKSTSIVMGVSGYEGSTSPVYVTAYKDSQTGTNQLDTRQLQMFEDVANKKVDLCVLSGSNWLPKGKVSTSNTYEAGWGACRDNVEVDTTDIGNGIASSSNTYDRFGVKVYRTSAKSQYANHRYYLKVRDWQPSGSTDTLRVAEVWYNNSSSNIVSRMKIDMSAYVAIANVGIDVGNWYQGSKTITVTGVSGVSTTVDVPTVTNTTWTESSADNWYATISLGGTTRASASKDFSGIRTAGTYSGKSSVRLSDTLTWGTAPSKDITVSQNSVAVSTTGRTNSSGTTENVSKTINLYTSSSASGLTATFYVAHSSNNADNYILKKTQTCSDANLVAGNIKSGVSIFGVSGTYAPSSTIPEGYILASGVTSGAPVFSTYSSQKTLQGVNYFAYQNSNATNSANDNKAKISISLQLEDDGEGKMTATARGYLGHDPSKTSTGSKILKIEREYTGGGGTPTVNTWTLGALAAEDTYRDSKDLKLPVSVKVNGTAYPHTFTLTIKAKKVGTDKVIILQGTKSIARLNFTS